MRHAAKGAFAAACLSLVGLVATTGGGATPATATAAGAFPGQGFLPDNRAWEMVSPAVKNGGYAVPYSRRTRAAADGSAIGWISLAAFGDAVGAGVATDYVSTRSADPDPGHSGWSTHAITPKQDPNQFGGILTSLEPLYQGEFSEDLQRGVFYARSPLTADPGVEDVLNLYRRTDLRSPGEGAYELVTACPLCAKTKVPLPPLSGTGFDFNLRPEVVTSTPDLERLLFESQQRLTPDTPEIAERERLFEWEAGEVRLAGKVPSGAASECAGVACVAAPVSKAGQGGAGGDLLTPHTLSDGSDGHSRVFFTVPTTGPEGTEGNLYVRTDAATTAKLNASERAAADAFAPAKYFDATPDGARAFFTTTQALSDDAPIDGNAKLYSYDTTKPASAPDNLTLLSPDAEKADDGSVEGVIGAGEDGAYVYFVAQGQLVSGEPKLDGIRGIYLWHAGALRYLGPLNALQGMAELLSISGNANTSPRQARLSANGTQLLFSSFNGEGLLSRYGGTDHDHGGCVTGGIGGCRELYLYDALADDLRCVSCRPDGSPSATVPNSTLYVRAFSGSTNPATHETQAFSADGRYVFFSTGQRLVQADTNGTTDAYVYDTASEEPSLLSSGEDSSPSWFLDASADGSDAFIVTREQLSGWDVGNDYDLYDARIGGGFPEPPPPPPGCAGDACQPAPLALNDPTPSSSGFQGPGSPSARKGKPRCPQGKRRVKTRGGKSRCVKKQRKKKRGTNAKRRAGR
jgi:hypothetical protein